MTDTKQQLSLIEKTLDRLAWSVARIEVHEITVDLDAVTKEVSAVAEYLEEMKDDETLPAAVAEANTKLSAIDDHLSELKDIGTETNKLLTQLVAFMGAQAAEKIDATAVDDPGLARVTPGELLAATQAPEPAMRHAFIAKHGTSPIEPVPPPEPATPRAEAGAELARAHMAADDVTAALRKPVKRRRP